MTLHDCRDHARLLGSYLDGELDPARLIEIDEHVGVCETCREEAQLMRAVRGSLKRVVRTASPTGLGERIATAMAAERTREDARGDARAEDVLGARAPLVNLASWRTMVPLATAAALALMWGAATRGSQSATAEARAGFGDDLLAELISEHSQSLPLEAKDPDSVRGLERYVGVPLHPSSFERAGLNARLVGGRVVPLRAQRAAMLQYVVGTGDDARRVSVVVYDAQKIQIGTANLAPREIGTAEVRVGREKGYSVAATQRAGVGYVVASDLDPERNEQFAAMIYDDR
jgi:anti-sigma factor RsiW